MTLRLELVERRPRRRARSGRLSSAGRGRRSRPGVHRASGELERLAGAYERAAAGEARTVVIAGEAGIGKTRLVDAFAAGSPRPAAGCMAGGCLPLGAGGLPYGPLVEALRSLCPRRRPGRAAGPARSEPGRARPADARDPVARGSGRRRSRWRRPARRPPEDRFAQVRLFELVLGVLERLARITPVVLVVDDLHWADPSTRDLVAFLVRNLRDERVLLVATIRTDGSRPGRHLPRLPGGAGAGERVDRIDLARFDRDDLARSSRMSWAAAGSRPRRPDARTVGRQPVLRRADPRGVARERARRSSRHASATSCWRGVAAVSETGQEVLRVASAAGGRVDDDSPRDRLGPAPGGCARACGRPSSDGSSSAGEDDPIALRVQPRAPAGGRPRLAAPRRAGAAPRPVCGGARGPRPRSGSGRRPTGPPPTAAEIADHWQAAGDDRRALTATVDAALAAERAPRSPTPTAGTSAPSTCGTAVDAGRRPRSIARASSSVPPRPRC